MEILKRDIHVYMYSSIHEDRVLTCCGCAGRDGQGVMEDVKRDIHVHVLIEALGKIVIWIVFKGILYHKSMGYITHVQTVIRPFPHCVYNWPWYRRLLVTPLAIKISSMVYFGHPIQ